MSTNKYTSNNNPTLVAVSNADGETPVYLYADPSTHGLVVSATISSVGIATSANQTNGSQLTQIVDAGGEAVTVTGGKLDVNATASLAGVAIPISGATTAVGVAIVDGSGNQITSFGGGTQYADGAVRGTATGTIMMVDDGTNIQSASGNSSGEQIVQAKQNGSWNVTNVSGTVSLPTGAATAALQTQPGTDIGDVTINNTSGAGAVNIQDGGNSITVDGSVTASGNKTNNNAVPSTDNIGVLPALVNASSPTFTEGNQSLLSINTTGNLRTTLNQVAGVAISTGNGPSGTGVLRVAQVNDGTGVIATVGAVTAITNALPAGTNAIGKLAANSGVDIGDVDVTTVGTITPGTAATSLGKAEDAAHTSGDVGVMDLGVRNDTLADQTNTNADYGSKSIDIKGRVMTAGAPRALKATTQVQLSNTTAETTIIAATASTFHDVYGLILANTGATTTKVSIRDDTAGTVRMIIEVPTLETRGFMLPVDSAAPQTTVNKNWTAQCGSATTALEVTALYVSMV